MSDGHTVGTLFVFTTLNRCCVFECHFRAPSATPTLLDAPCCMSQFICIAGTVRRTYSWNYKFHKSSCSACTLTTVSQLTIPGTLLRDVHIETPIVGLNDFPRKNNYTQECRWSFEFNRSLLYFTFVSGGLGRNVACLRQTRLNLPPARSLWE